MFAIVNELHFKDGDYIFKEGTYGDWIYIINSGEVEISKSSKGEKIIVEVLKAGEIFGEMSFIDKTPRSASAIARGRVSVGILDREQLDYEFNKLSTEVRTVVKALVNRLRQTTNRVSALSGREDMRAFKSLEIQFKTARDFKKAYSVNIGGGGILLRTEEPVTMGAKCDLRFNLP
ncbi:MAG: cyclic nucleotide-binding domain-containing protein, partial [Pseudomonadota bacterium]